MRTSIISTLALAAVVASACDGTTEPTIGPKESVLLDFCASEQPVWLAVQNQGEEWEQVSSSSFNSFSFAATPKVSIAFVTTDGFDRSTTILNVDRDELEGISGELCTESVGTKSVSGTVSGLTGAQVARISMALASDGASSGNTSYSLTELPDGPLDLVATRAATSTTQPPDRVIVRHNLDLADGATIPVLNFGAAEAVALASSTLTFANRGTDPVDVSVVYFSANGTEHQLMQFTGATGGTGSVFVSVPDALRVAGDLHAVAAFASSAAGLREVTQFYTAPGDKTATFGPILNAPIKSVVTTTPYLRPRLTVASQSEYPVAMEAFWSQLSGGSFRTLRIITTAAFLGGRPGTWTLELPDFSEIGYLSSWAFPNSTNLSANARGYDGDASVILGAAPTAGVTIKSSIRAAADAVALASR